MAERRPPGFNVDLGFSDSKEVGSIPARLRLAAVGAWTLCGSWSASKRTNGYVPAAILKRLGVTAKVVEALVSATLWEHAEGGAIRFTGWTKWQRTKEEIDAFNKTEANRKKAARDAAKRAAAEASGNGTIDALLTSYSGVIDGQEQKEPARNYDAIDAATPPPSSRLSEMSGRTSAGRSHDVPPDTRDPELRVKSSSPELSKKLTAVGSGSAPPPTFPDHCSIHRHVEHPPPCGDCRRTRIENGHALTTTVDVEAVKRTADALARRNCRRCEGTGWITETDDPWAEAQRCPEHP